MPIRLAPRTFFRGRNSQCWQVQQSQFRRDAKIDARNATGVSDPGFTRSKAVAQATVWQANRFSLVTSHLESALITAASGATVEWGAVAV